MTEGFRLPRRRDQGGAFARTFALFATDVGDLFAVGENSHGQLGLGDLVDRAKPTRVALPSEGRDAVALAARVAAADDWACCLAAGGATFTWGRGRRALGHGLPPGVDVVSPRRVD